MHVRILFANPSHNANSVTEFDFPWSADTNANFVLLILRTITGMSDNGNFVCISVSYGKSLLTLYHPTKIPQQSQMQ